MASSSSSSSSGPKAKKAKNAAATDAPAAAPQVMGLSGIFSDSQQVAAAAGLSSMFSDSSLQKFARVLRPAELTGVPKKQAAAAAGGDAATGPKKRVGKKAKWDDEKRKERDLKNAAATSANAATAATASTAGTAVPQARDNKKSKKRKAADAAIDADAPPVAKRPSPAQSTAATAATTAAAAAPAAAAPASEADADADAGAAEHEEKHDTSKDHLTAFFGNIPISETVKSVKKYCARFGDVESVRLRSIPVAGTAVDDAGNQNLVRKVCANSRTFLDIKGSFNAYVVFKSEEAVTAALQANNEVWGTRHLRVDRMNPTLFDTKRSVFIGSLPHYADEEDVRAHFAKALPNGHADIEGVRIVRDPATLVGKGIGYMLLRDRDAVMKALSLNDVMFKKVRKLRVTVCGKRTKRGSDGGRKRDAPSSGAGGAPGGSSDSSSSSSGGGSGSPKAPKKEKKVPQFKVNRDNAKKRINLKSANTRNKALVAKKQKKAAPGKKGKRLGGVVKRAMKAEKSKKKKA